jgi:hypothetical protein
MRIVKAVRPLNQVRNGVTKPYFVQCSDNETYVVKFQQNPEGKRVLANEYVASKMASLLSLPVPDPALIEVDDQFVRDHGSEISEHVGSPLQSGLHFGTVKLKKSVQITDSRMIGRALNRDIVPDLLVFDQLICNKDRDSNGGNLLFDLNKMEIVVLDHTHAFDLGAIWRETDLKMRIGQSFELFDSSGYVYRKLVAYVEGNNPFHPILAKIAGMTNSDLWNIINTVPEEWELSMPEKHALIDYLIDRQTRIHEVLPLLAPVLPRWKGGL